MVAGEVDGRRPRLLSWPPLTWHGGDGLKNSRVGQVHVLELARPDFGDDRVAPRPTAVLRTFKTRLREITDLLPKLLL